MSLADNNKTAANYSVPFFHIRRDNVVALFISGLLIVSFIGDGMNAFLRFYQISFERASIVPRFILEAFIILFFVFNYRINNKRISIIFIVILSFGLFFTLGFGTYLFKNINANVLQNIIFFNKMFFFSLCFCFLLFLNQNRKAINIGLIYRTYEIIILISGAAIIAGFIFHIRQFSSYELLTTRFGYKGLIMAVNEATVFWIIALFYGLHKLKFEGKKLYFLIAFICCLLMGTKGAWIFSLLTVSIYFINEYRRKALILLFVIIPIGFFFRQYIVLAILNSYNSLDIFEHFRYQQSIDMNALSILLSGRDYFITSKLLPNIVNFWTPLNWLFGGQDRMTYLTEMDFIDMFMFFGIIGEIIYLSLYLFIFSTMKNPFKYLFILIYFLMAFFNGHTFESGINAMYLALFVIKASNAPQNQVQAIKCPTRV